MTNAAKLLSVKNINLRHPLTASQRISSAIFHLTCTRDEILGLYGLMGAGRTELMETIFGLHPKNASGEISRKWQVITKIKSPADAIRAGIALVPEDRKLQGLILNQTVDIQYQHYHSAKITAMGNHTERTERKGTHVIIISASLAIKTSSGNNDR